MGVFSSLLAATPTDLPPWTSLGLGAFVAAPAWGVAWKLYQDNKALIKDALARERELSSTTIPALTEATRLLSTAPARFDEALNQASNATKASEVDLLMRRLEQTIDSLSRERGR